MQNQQWCETPPSITIAVSRNTLSFTLRHPKLPDGPLYNPAFQLDIAPDGSFNGADPKVVATLTGRISGTHMTGQIIGLLCEFAFSADRA